MKCIYLLGVLSDASFEVGRFASPSSAKGFLDSPFSLGGSDFVLESADSAFASSLSDAAVRYHYGE